MEESRVEKHVIFLNRFVSIEDLKGFIGAADIYVTPYLDRAQITSGTLAYAFGSGKAVVSTPYWHAEELLADGRGVLVPFNQPPALAEAVCGLLDDPERMKTMRRNAYAAGRAMTWPAVAEQYLESFARACADRRSVPRTAFAEWTLDNRPGLRPDRQLAHIARMSDRTGIFQHAIFNVPNYHEGYCVDDNARPFILSILLAEQEHPPARQNLENFTSVYLAFLAAALDYGTGRFRNFMSHGHEWLEHAGSEDSQRNHDPEALEIGLNSLRWLASVQTTQTGCFRLIGSNGFYPCEGNRADFDSS